MNKIPIFVLIALSIANCPLQLAANQIKPEANEPNSTTSSAVQCATEECHERRKKFLIGIIRTAVITSLSTTTVTVPSTCYNDLNAGVACTGKRRRRLHISELIMQDSFQEMEPVYDVEGSFEATTSGPTPLKRLKRLLIWSTSTQVIQITATSTNVAQILTVSLSCTIAGVALPPACAG